MRETTIDPKERVYCDCGCGEIVTLTLVGGFGGATCTIEACQTRQCRGIESVTVRRSAALNLRAPDSVVMHRENGLVWFD